MEEQENSRLLQMPFQHFGKNKDGVTEVQGKLNVILLSAGGQEVMHEEKLWGGRLKFQYSLYPARQVDLLFYLKNICSACGSSGTADFRQVVELLMSEYKGLGNRYA